MATTISRTADTDDDGTGTTGTIRNNAWKTAIYDAIDALFTAATFQVTGAITAGGGIAAHSVNGVITGNDSTLEVGAINFKMGASTGHFRVIQSTTGGSATLLDLTDTGSFTITGTGFVMASWPTTAGTANAILADGAALKIATSVLAAKHDVQPLTLADALPAVMALRPVIYRSRVDEDQRQWPGFIAEWMAQDAPLLATYDYQTGKLRSVAYDRAPAYLVPVVQDHELRIQALEAQGQALKAR